jgi:hypothetical protein
MTNSKNFTIFHSECCLYIWLVDVGICLFYFRPAHFPKRGRDSAIFVSRFAEKRPSQLENKTDPVFQNYHKIPNFCKKIFDGDRLVFDQSGVILTHFDSW